ncbi:MAG: hypothetical protein PHV55_01920, partial [Candidatus Omnitrophica bacterium]|nr:hypothetical protein [Candidatus Omnitrophota bacterium]
LENDAVTIDELTEEVEKLHAANPEIGVLLHADRVAQFKYVAKILDILSGMDVRNINIAVTPEK